MIAEPVSRWLNKLPKLAYIIERLKEVQIQNEDFESIIKKTDSKETLFYCDPPYPFRVRNSKGEYKFEFTDYFQVRFLEMANKIKGKIAISGYESDIYNYHLKTFHKHSAPKNRGNLKHSVKQEILWTNYD